MSKEEIGTREEEEFSADPPRRIPISELEQELELPIGRECRSKEENLTVCVEDWKDKYTLERM